MTAAVVESLVTAKFFAVLDDVTRFVSPPYVAMTELVAPTPRAVLAIEHDPTETVVVQVETDEYGLHFRATAPGRA